MYNLVGHELAKVIEECDGFGRRSPGDEGPQEGEDYLHGYYQETVEVKAQRLST